MAHRANLPRSCALASTARACLTVRGLRVTSAASGGSTNRHGLTSVVPPAIPYAWERFAWIS